MEWIINIEHSDLVKDQILTQKFEMNDLDFLYNASFRDDYGLGIEGLFSGSFTFGKYITAPALEGKIVSYINTALHLPSRAQFSSPICLINKRALLGSLQSSELR